MKTVRTIASLALRGLLVLLILGQLAYLFRRPLFEGAIRGELEHVLAQALDADVRVGSIRGNWLTTISVDELSITNGQGAVRTVKQAALRAVLDPLALISGDLSGIGQVRLQVAELELDLRGSGAEEEPDDQPAVGPPDLGMFASLVPNGARIELDSLRFRGPAGDVRGDVQLLIPPHPGGQVLRLTGSGPGCDFTAALDDEGRCTLALRALEPLRWLQMFVAVPNVTGGRLDVSSTFLWTDVPELSAEVGLVGVRHLDQPIDTVSARVLVDDRGIHVERLAALSPGVELLVRDAGLDFDQEGGTVMETVRGRVLLAIDGLEPFADLLPDEVRGQLPIHGRISAQAGDGWLTADPSFLSTAAFDINLGGGAWPLSNGPDRHPTVDLIAVVTDPSRLPLPEDFPFEVRSGTVRAHLERQPVGVAGSAEVDVVVAEPDGQLSSVRGSVGVRGGTGAWTVSPDLVIEGGVLLEMERVELDGEVRVEGDLLAVSGFEVRSGSGGVARLNGAVDLAREDLQALLRGGRLDLRFERFDVGRWSRLLDLPYGGAVSGSVVWQPEQPAPLTIDINADATGLVRGETAPTRVSLQLVTDSSGTRLRQLEIRNEVLTMGGEAAIPTAATVDALVDTLLHRSAALERDVTGTLDLQASDLSRLELSWLDVAFGGAVQASLKLSGQIRSPLPEFDVQLTDFSVVSGAESLVEAVSGKLRADAEHLTIRDLMGKAGGIGGVVEGGIAWGGGELAIEILALRPDGGGRVTLKGRIGTVDPATLLTALRTDSRVELEIAGLDLAPWLLKAGVTQFSGRADAYIRWIGEGQPQLNASLTSRLSDTTGGEFTIEAALSADHARAAIETLELRSGAAVATGQLELTDFGLDRLIDAPGELPSAGVKGELALAGFDLNLLEPVLGIGSVGGIADGSATLAGTFGDPQPQLELRLTDGFLRPRGATRVTDISGKLVVTRKAVRVDRLTAELGAGPVVIEGAFTTDGELYRDWERGQCDFVVRGKNVLIHRGRGIKLRGDLDLTAKGGVAAILLRGDVTLHSSKFVTRIPFVSIDQVGGEAVEKGIVLPGFDLGPAVHVTLDVNVVTHEPLDVRTNLFRGGIATRLTVRGPISAPVLIGTLSGVDGRLTLPGARFAASTLLFEFKRDNPRFPEVTVNAQGRRHGIDLSLSVRGPYNEPEIQLSSNPPFPNEDLLVLITTGARPETLKDRGAAGAASIVGSYLVEELADYVFGSESTEAKEGFIDSVNFESGTEIGPDGTESLLLEVRLRGPIYLQGERDIYQDINLGVLYRVRLR